MNSAPLDIQLIGDLLAIRWHDGCEDFFTGSFLRENSPSAENVGERDIFGKIHGGVPRRPYPGVKIENWEYQGNYAVRFDFSDGHRTGLYSWEYLRHLANEQRRIEQEQA